VQSLEYWPIEKFINYEKNPRKNDHAVEKTANAIREFGFRVPVIAKSDGLVVDGHLRLKAAAELGLKEIPVLLADDLSEAQIQAFRISVNQVSNLADWDLDKLKVEIDSLIELDFDTDLLGFEEGFIDNLLDEPEEVDIPEEGETPEPQPDPITKKGDIWILGKHRLMCGDSTMIDDVEKLMDGEKADMVFTDPPYGINVVKSSNEIGGNGVAKTNNYQPIKGDDGTQYAEDFYNLSKEFLKIETFIIWGGNYFTNFLQPSRCWLVWDKKNSGDFSDCELAWTNLSTGGVRLYEFLWNGMIRGGDKQLEGDRVHPTQKPVGLFLNILKDFESVNILDGFGGSGSTLIACENLNRVCYMMELSEQYCDVIIKRWQNLTGEDAVLESTGESYNSMGVENA
jgi:DNA modification methylase